MRVVVFISFDPAIDIEVDGHQHAERLILIFDFNLFGLTVMVEQFHAFSDQSHRAFIQPSVEGDAAVFVDLSMPIRLLHNSPLASEVRDCVVARAFVQSLIGR